MMREVPCVPANPRVRSAVGIASRECARRASPNPGISFSINGAVASGVTSERETPVPPVVTIQSIPDSSAREISRAMSAASSATITTPTTE